MNRPNTADIFELVEDLKPRHAAARCFPKPADRCPGIKNARLAFADILVPRPYAQMQSLLDATQPKGRRYYWKSEYLASLSPELFDVLATALRIAEAVIRGGGVDNAAGT